MREGYKETDVGIIPVDWEVVEQQEVATFYNGRAYKLSEWEEVGTPVIRLQNLTGSGKDYYYSQMKLPEHQYCSYGDLLYMWSATFGPVWWYGEKAIYHYHIWKISTDDTRLSKNFLFYLLNRVTTRMKNEAHGSTMMHVTKGGMEKLKIPLPPLKEQEKIADILSTADDKIEAIASQIQKAETLKKGLLQKLLSEGIGHTEFKDSELGRIPVSWEVVKLGDIAKVKDGTHFSPKSKDGSCKYVTSKNIRFGHFDETTISYISQEEHDNIYKRCPVKKGQVLLTKDGANTGNACLNPLDEPFSLLSSVAVIDGEKYSLYNEYLLQWLLSSLGQKSLKNSMAGQAITRLTLTKISAHKLIFPSFQEQIQIADILSTADKKIEVLRAKKVKYETLKQGLMQKLLMGDVRVKI